MKTNNGFSKFISMKKFDYKYHQTAVIIHLEIIYLYCLGIILLILISDLKLNETKLFIQRLITELFHLTSGFIYFLQIE